MWSGIIIITGMVLLALLVFVGIAVWYSTEEEERYNFKTKGSMLVVDKLPEVTDRIFCVRNYPGQHIGNYDMYMFQAVKIGECKTDTYFEDGEIKCSSYVELEDEDDD